jgi:dolichyl-phosphate-mannose--protein O-mannosyl transferase
MTKRQDYKTHAATFQADGQKVQFVHKLNDLEMRDHRVATKVHNETEATKLREELQDEQQRYRKIKAV